MDDREDGRRDAEKYTNPDPPRYRDNPYGYRRGFNEEKERQGREDDENDAYDFVPGSLALNV